MKNPIARTFLCGCIAILATAPSAVLAKDNDKTTAPPAIFQAVIDCKEITDASARLTCYDEKVATLAAAQESRQVVIADREQIKEAKRGLFGFSLPTIKLFGAGSNKQDDEERIERLETTVISARQFGFGKWTITLAEGGTWQQTDSVTLNRDPSPGDPVVVKTGAIGSYMASINGQRSIRIKRIK
tara:strand:+ start:4024 stop:4581 length:558 start_codon:yes stop_codon:yes gene_type:complete